MLSHGPAESLVCAENLVQVKKDLCSEFAKSLTKLEISLLGDAIFINRDDE